jgi:hypothetical protein
MMPLGVLGLCRLIGRHGRRRMKGLGNCRHGRQLGDGGLCRHGRCGLCKGNGGLWRGSFVDGRFRWRVSVLLRDGKILGRCKFGTNNHSFCLQRSVEHVDFLTPHNPRFASTCGTFISRTPQLITIIRSTKQGRLRWRGLLITR